MLVFHGLSITDGDALQPPPKQWSFLIGETASAMRNKNSGCGDRSPRKPLRAKDYHHGDVDHVHHYVYHGGAVDHGFHSSQGDLRLESLVSPAALLSRLNPEVGWYREVCLPLGTPPEVFWLVLS